MKILSSMYFGENQEFLGKISSPSSEQTNKPCKNPTESGGKALFLFWLILLIWWWRQYSSETSSLSYSSATDCQLARHQLLTLVVFQRSTFSLLKLPFTLLNVTTLSLNAHRCWYVRVSSARHFIRAVPYTGCSVQNGTEQCITCFQFQPVLQTFHVFPQTVRNGHKLFTIFQTYTNHSCRDIGKRAALFK
jgi:hypothetical protein